MNLATAIRQAQRAAMFKALEWQYVGVLVDFDMPHTVDPDDEVLWNAVVAIALQALSGDDEPN